MKLDLPRGMAQRFALGRLLATPNALAALVLADVSPIDLLKRHAAGDWGDVPLHDLRENEFAIEMGNRLMSSYMLLTKARVWVITEADRSATTLLLPDEY